MKGLKTLYFILLVSLTGQLFAQTNKLVLDTTIQVTENGLQISKPWAGGLDCPVYSSMDLNNDGIKDLVVFDHKTDRITTFINNNTSGISYHYAPEYTQYFPPTLHDWIKLYDYNCDGFEDIFTHGNGGIACYRNNGTNPVSFSFVTPQINSFYHFGTTFFSSNIYVSSVNVPSFVDMDNDGDMDIISFPLGASYIEYHRNYSMDSTGLCGGFRFYNMRQCWGYFTLLGNTNAAVLPPLAISNGSCPAYAATYPRNFDVAQTETDTLRHAGNILEAIDMEGDGDKDLLTGDIVGSYLLYIENGGIQDSAYAVSQDTSFPSYNLPARMENIAAPYIVDVNNDGKKDMMVSNFNADLFQGAGENYFNTNLYLNVSSNPNAYQFQYQKNTFLTDEMIDVGTGAHPVFFDADEDGLQDLIIGSDFFYYTGGTRNAQLTYYRNTGTPTNPEFNLITRDYAGLAAYNFSGAYPTFGDIDGDGDKDMILGNTNSSVTLFRNTAGAGNPSVFVLDSLYYQNISVGSNGQQSIPVLYDLNKDLKLDLIIGERTGVLNYYENTGSVSNPVFTFVTDTLGAVDVRDQLNLLGYSAPVFFDSAGVTQMLVGNYNGYIYHYNNIDNNLSGVFNLVDSTFEDIFEPKLAVPALTDLDGDGLFDLVIGNAAGGLRYYSETTTGISESIPDPLFNCYPNPASGIIYLDFKAASATNRMISIIDVLGRVVINTASSKKNVAVDISALFPGTYIISVNENGSSVTQKIIVN
jgi:Secretion system C-terminal sorting domain/FG-GAP-like repeat